MKKNLAVSIIVFCLLTNEFIQANENQIQELECIQEQTKQKEIEVVNTPVQNKFYNKTKIFAGASGVIALGCFWQAYNAYLDSANTQKVHKKFKQLQKSYTFAALGIIFYNGAVIGFSEAKHSQYRQLKSKYNNLKQEIENGPALLK